MRPAFAGRGRAEDGPPSGNLLSERQSTLGRRSGAPGLWWLFDGLSSACRSRLRSRGTIHLSPLSKKMRQVLIGLHGRNPNQLLPDGSFSI